MKRSKRRQRLALHPGYEAAVKIQKLRLEAARSIVYCVKYCLLNGGDGLCTVDAVTIAYEMLDGIVNGLDLASLQASAEKWLVSQDTAAVN